MGRIKGSKNRLKGALNDLKEAIQNPPETVIKESKRAPRAKKAAKRSSEPRLGAALKALLPAEELPKTPHQRVVIDLTTGEILGPDKSLDLSIIPDTKYSHSFISTVATCTAQAYFRKSHAKSQKQYPMEKGSCIHAVIEGWLKEGKDPLTHLPDAWQHWVTDQLDNMSEKHQEDAKAGYAGAYQMLEEFVMENNSLLRQIRPEDVEVNFDLLITINTSLGPIQRNVTGKIDLVLWDEKRQSYGVLDWKSGITVPSKDERKRNVQFAIYQKAAAHLYGKPASFMEFYVLPGLHLCDERFSSKKHPRPLLERTEGCKGLQYAFRVPIRGDEEIQEMIDLYYANQIIKWEAGIIGKDGMHDVKNNCLRCMYREACDEWKKPFPAPVFVR